MLLLGLWYRIYIYNRITVRLGSANSAALKSSKILSCSEFHSVTGHVASFGTNLI